MKLFLIKKRNFPPAFYLLMLLILLSTLSLNLAVTSVMAGQSDMPIYRVENDTNSIAVTMNVDGYINIDKLKEITNGTKITLFLSEYYCNNYCNDIAELSKSGFCLGVLDRSMKGLSQKQIKDILAYRIETFSCVSSVNTTLVRFENNLYDSTCISTVYDVDLFPVQWACDAKSQEFTSGDIILVENMEELKNTVKKAREEGFRLATVEELCKATSHT